MSEEEDITIVGVVKEKVGSPRNDGTAGSDLYRVPIQLSRTPSSTWAQLFRQTWDSPPEFTTMHRKGIASVVGDQIVLDGTTVEEVRDYHAKTLKLVVEKVNAKEKVLLEKQRHLDERRAAEEQGHRERVAEVADEVKFE